MSLDYGFIFSGLSLVCLVFKDWSFFFLAGLPA